MRAQSVSDKPLDAQRDPANSNVIQCILEGVAFPAYLGENQFSVLRYRFLVETG
jgi:hypothetical protein